MPTYSFLVTEEYENRPIRRAALTALGLSSGQFKRAKFHGQMLVDGAPVHADFRLRSGQTLTLVIPEAENTKPEAVNLSLSVPYEDEYLLMVDKPAPLPTAPSVHQSGMTLENAVYWHLSCPEPFVYRPVNRLDKGTSGLMLIARDARTQHMLQQMLHTPDFIREYLAVVDGAPEDDEGVIERPIGKADGATVRREVRPDGKRARTFFRVLRRGRRSLVRLRLDTGRTHQIRVHMQSLGCPVTGDFLYGTELPQLPGRFALHSAYLRFRHPITGEWIERESPLPKELEDLEASEGPQASFF